MLRRRFLQSLLAVAGLAPKVTIAVHPPVRPAVLAGGNRAPRILPDRRAVLLQTSPVAGFQYHEGESVWSRLTAGDALHFVREPTNAYDNKAVRVEWEGHKLGYVPRIENHAVAQLLDRGEELSARIVELKESSDPWEQVTFAISVIV